LSLKGFPLLHSYQPPLRLPSFPQACLDTTHTICPEKRAGVLPDAIPNSALEGICSK